MALPVIGILSTREAGETVPRYVTTGHYVEQIELAGGVPVQLPLSLRTGPEQLARWVRLCDGVLLPGGDDLDASLYGQTPWPGAVPCGDFDLHSQQNELAFIRMAAAAGLPMLGICLGMQAMNVAFGGSLIQDIPSQKPNALAHRQDRTARAKTTHTVALAAGTLAASLSGLPEGGELAVNTFHHQAVATPAPGFTVSGRAPDGIIEAIEKPHGNLLAVQWHPENLSDAGIPAARGLFAWLVAQADAR